MSICLSISSFSNAFDIARGLAGLRFGLTGCYIVNQAVLISDSRRWLQGIVLFLLMDFLSPFVKDKNWHRLDARSLRSL